MPCPRSLKPSYCLDKSSGRAYVKLNGKRNYLGKHNTQSRDEYDRVIGEWIAAGRQGAASTVNDAAGITISTLIAAFWSHAQTYYANCVTPEGKITGEMDNYPLALKPLRRLYGVSPATEFGPLALKSLRSEMIKLDGAGT